MVCDRCVMAVRDVLVRHGLSPVSVELGHAVIDGSVDDTNLKSIGKDLESIGFELLNDKKERIVEKIKTLIISSVHNDNASVNVNLSSFLSSNLHSEYSALSRLFSAHTGITIEKYYIFQRIERVKELLSYGELTLSQIADTLGYSSTAYLSSQFKSVTGITPSRFKSGTTELRKPLDKV